MDEYKQPQLPFFEEDDPESEEVQDEDSFAYQVAKEVEELEQYAQDI